MNNFIAKAEILINAPAQAVWQALTDPAMVKQYLFGTEMSVSEWQVGGQIRYRGVWQGKSYEDKGEILELIPEQKLVSTYYSSMSGKPDAPENYSRVSYELAPEVGGVKLTITQENNPTAESAQHSENNWRMVLQSVKQLVEK
jgi:uncharacterized protein YndB with AHSA1/START domain